MEKFIDHKGNEFNTLKEMCDYWKIHTVTFSSRIKAGMSLKDALETKIRKNCKPCVDHLGNEFESEKEMAKYWGISYMLYKSRKKSKWNIKERLEGKATRKNTYFDHLGNEFGTLKEMCDNWKINQTTYNSRIKAGWSQEEALTGKSRSCVYDHKGNKFKTLAEMCKYWDMFDCQELECGKEWDGHTEEDVTRLLSLEQQPNRCYSCIHYEEQDGSNCYECVKGIADNFEVQSTNITVEMHPKEAIEILEHERDNNVSVWTKHGEKIHQALTMGIKALKAQIKADECFNNTDSSMIRVNLESQPTDKCKGESEE